MDAVTVRLGSIDLPIEPGAAANQRVSVSPRWRKALVNSSPTAPGLPEARADELMAALTAATHRDGTITRDRLQFLAQTLPPDVAYLIVMAWGLGTTGRWNTFTPLVRRALVSGCDQLELSRRAAETGKDLTTLWSAHFDNRPPPASGQVSFGSKWLYAIGHETTSGPRPLVYDDNVHRTLSKCAGFDDFAPATGRPRSSWLRWCELAATLAAQSDGLTAEDIEFAVFQHASQCDTPSACQLQHDDA